MRYGVPQGSVLGPLLFCIFINDLPLQISNDKVSNDIFADGSFLHTRGKNIQLVETSLKGSLNVVADWCGSNSMIIHPAKTKSMLIATRDKHRVLGVTKDAEMKWQSHPSNVCKIVSKSLFLLSQLKYYVNVKARKLFSSAHI